MNNVNPFFYGFLLLLCILSCSKDDKIVNPDSDKETAIDGFITDEQGQYIKDAFIEFGNANTTTNMDGYFQFPSTKFEGELYIKASKPGYFPGSRTLFLEKSKSAHVRISLLQKSFSQSFNSSSIAKLDAGKVKLEFPPNGIVDDKGQAYNGTVKVAIKYLDPTAFSIRNIMPGDLVGLNATGEMQQLGSFGMAAIELQSTSGAKLKVKENTEVVLKIEIPQTLRSNAPYTIPLWYFDETTGLWKEQGLAVKNGNLYEGKVTHFSFWNCDISWPLVHLKGRIIDYSNKAISNANIKLSMVRTGMTGYGRTNIEGIFEGMVPKNEALILDLIDECNNVIFSDNIGPFSIDTDLGDIAIVINSPHLVRIEGTVVDCNNQGLENAVVIIQSGLHSYSLRSNSEGKYGNTLTFCNLNPVSVTAYDLKSLKQSATVSYNLPGTVLVAPLQVCNDTIQADEFISIVLSDGAKLLFFESSILDVYLNVDQHNIVSLFDTSNFYFDLGIYSTPKLAQQLDIFGVTILANDTIYSYFPSMPNIIGTMQYFKVASIIGKYYEGTFHAEGIFKENFNTGEQYGIDLTLDGAFRIKRKQ